MNNQRKLKLGLILLPLAFIALGFLLIRDKDNIASADLVSFAKCLGEKRIIMYGAAWCPHCQTEKKAFGEAFEFVPYVECPENTKLCLDKGIRSYPTWELPDGNRLEGEQGLVKLSQVSSCKL